jgi:sulfoxide reductase heme-binding subunit YedZ
MNRSDKHNWQVLLGVAMLVAGASAAWLATAGHTDANIRVALRQTARLAFVLYLAVLVARPLQQLLRSNWTAAMLRNRRLIGVAFAATMTVHLGLIAWRFGSQADLDFPGTAAFGAVAYAIFYLMLITSFERPRRALAPRAWKNLHRTGLVAAGVIFGLPRSLEELGDPAYLIYGIPFATALLIRLTAWRRSRRPGS